MTIYVCFYFCLKINTKCYKSTLSVINVKHCECYNNLKLTYHNKKEQQKYLINILKFFWTINL